MLRLREMIWKKVCEHVKSMTDNDEKIVFHADKEQEFYNKYQSLRDDFITFMSNAADQDLDRHKNAAVIIIALSETSVIERKGNSAKKFMGTEMLAVNVALSYMRESLQKTIEEKPEELHLNPEEAKFILENDDKCRDYSLPNPFSCPDNSYAYVLARDVYFSKQRDKLFPPTLANTLFLLEAFSLERYKVEYYYKNRQER